MLVGTPRNLAISGTENFLFSSSCMSCMFMLIFLTSVPYGTTPTSPVYSSDSIFCRLSSICLLLSLPPMAFILSCACVNKTLNLPPLLATSRLCLSFVAEIFRHLAAYLSVAMPLMPPSSVKVFLRCMMSLDGTSLNVCPRGLYVPLYVSDNAL